MRTLCKKMPDRVGERILIMVNPSETFEAANVTFEVEFVRSEGDGRFVWKIISQTELGRRTYGKYKAGTEFPSYWDKRFRWIRNAP